MDEPRRFNIIKGKKPRVDLIGVRFGELVVVSNTGDINKGGYLWGCVCDCGESTIKSTAYLKRAKYQNCGCKDEAHRHRPPRKKKTVVRGKYVYWRYVGSAKRRNIKFELSLEDFIDLIYKKCHYCNSEPNQRQYVGEDDIVIYNGVDRVDNKIGYNKENCVPCCNYCNQMKSIFPIDVFLLHINKIYNHNKEMICAQAYG
jgi:hypothetical protein